MSALSRKVNKGNSLLVLIFLIHLFHYDFKLKQNLKQKSYPYVFIFYEESFPAQFKVKKSILSSFVKIMKKNNFKVRLISAQDLENIDLKSCSYLSFLTTAYPKYAESKIEKYLKGGGGLISFGGIPFSFPLIPKGKSWQLAKSESNLLRNIGIKYYYAYLKGGEALLNEIFFAHNKDLTFKHSYIGINVATGYGGKIKKPTHGNVFPERIPQRKNIPIIKVYDTAGNISYVPLIIVSSWANPYDKSGSISTKWLLSSLKFEELKPILGNLFKILSFPILIEKFSSHYPLYLPEEKIELNLLLRAIKRETKFDLIIKLKNEAGKTIAKFEKRNFSLRGEKGKFSFKFKIEDNSSHFYEAVAYIIKENMVMDYAKTGFLIKRAINQAPSLAVKGRKFTINNKEEFIWGFNYYDSSNGELSWLDPNIIEIKEDFEMMHEFGARLVRIHYHHPKWFYDYSANPIFERYAHPLPDERDLRIMEAYILLAAKYGLIISFDLFSLLPQEMGDPKGWIGLSVRIKDQRKIKYQKEFIRIISRRFSSYPNITWDLWNEPMLKEKNISFLRNWVREIIAEFRNSGDRHLITVGGNISLELDDILDYISLHGYEVEGLKLNSISKPVLFQEFWLPAGLKKEEELRQAVKLKETLLKIQKLGLAGFLPWQWRRQSRLWEKLTTEKWDNDLGLILREDSSLRPAGYIWLEFMKSLTL